MCVEWENTSAHMDELWSGIVWMISLEDLVKRTRLKTILVMKYLHTKLVQPKLSLVLHHVIAQRTELHSE